MKYAIYNGKMVTLLELIRLTGLTKPSKLSHEDISCPCCGAHVHVYDVRGALGFRVVAEEVAGKSGKAKQSPGFAHDKGAAAPNCENSFRNDARYEGREKHPPDPHLKERVMARLSEKETEKKNNLALMTLLNVYDEKQIKDFADGWKKELSGHEFLEHHPHLFPFMAVVGVGAFQREFNNGKKHYVAFRADEKEDKQKLKYKNHRGSDAAVLSPTKIYMHWAGKDGGVSNLKVERGSLKKPMFFEVSRESVNSLAERAEKKLQEKHNKACVKPKRDRKKDASCPYQELLPI